MSKNFFRWQNFSVKFLNAVLQSSKTPAKYHPPVEYNTTKQLLLRLTWATCANFPMNIL